MPAGYIDYELDEVYPFLRRALALAVAHVVIEINTQRAACRAWAPIRKDRRHG